MAFADARKTRGHYLAEVVRSERITPHMQRVTFAGDELRALPAHGFDQWFRLFLPRADGTTDFDAVPEGFGMAGYLKFLMTDSATRPEYRAYTARALRPEAGELDVDFVAHGDEGVAGPWAQRARAGERVVVLDQGRGFEPHASGEYLLVGDESALPAIAGILRDLPRDARGTAIIEIPHAADAQQTDAPDGFEVRWLPREDPHERPGMLALMALRALHPLGPLGVYLAGEQALAAEGRRHLVAAGIPKHDITFTGYWKVGRAG
ncbi:siderophore-interacting protein [Microbacterium stercoris]|uniref:Siderophore-interacting protein n=1 Tax=Microbacterium stercoris TaxID=2820289 RepID=A0A939TXE7_9MICO|nr:siderophore-interacting protein [Microbacterium stercoris]MBO3663572.1 siderophore-interacting protein [Microbacterium stercoris]